MKEYRPRLLRKISNILFLVLATFVIYVITYCIQITNYYSPYISLVFSLVYLYFIFDESKVYFSLEGNEFKYYKKNKLVNTHILTNETNLNFKIVTKDLITSDLYLYIDDEEYDCIFLGLNKFYEMKSDLENVVGKKIIKLN